MPVTVVEPVRTLSDEMNARSSSFGAVVENAGLVIVVARVERPVDTVTSTAIGGTVVTPVKLTPLTSALLTVTLWLTGVKLVPAFVGVTVYVPLGTPLNE
jgi:hypothetical protein